MKLDRIGVLAVPEGLLGISFGASEGDRPLMSRNVAQFLAVVEVPDNDIKIMETS